MAPSKAELLLADRDMIPESNEADLKIRGNRILFVELFGNEPALKIV